MDVNFNKFNQLEIPYLTLCTPDKQPIYMLGLADDIKNTRKYNAISLLHFQVQGK